MPEPAAGPQTRPEIRDAATIVLVRRDADGAPRVLMGQRGSSAAFMPDLFVFPGGAVEPGDLALAGAAAAEPADLARLALEADPEVARALPFAAIRELWEETGLLLGLPEPEAAGRAGAAPANWAGFYAAGLAPRPAALRFFFRAVTPPGRPRRFDARFFLAEAASLACDPDAFERIDHELRHLHWVDLAAARALPLPFITTVVLGEVEARLAAPDAAPGVPFFVHDAQGSHVRML